MLEQEPEITQIESVPAAPAVNTDNLSSKEIANLIMQTAVKEQENTGTTAISPVQPVQTTPVQPAATVPEPTVEPTAKETQEEINYRQRYADSTREAQRLLAEKRQAEMENADLRNQLNQAQQTAQSQQTAQTPAEYTDDQLDQIAQDHPEYTSWVNQQKTERLERKLEEKVINRLTFQFKAKDSTEKALSTFPDLRDPSTALYRETARIIADIPALKTAPDGVLRAAELAKARLTVSQTQTVQTPQNQAPTANQPPLVPTGNTPEYKPNVRNPIDVKSLSAEELRKLANLPTREDRLT